MPSITSVSVLRFETGKERYKIRNAMCKSRMHCRIRIKLTERLIGVIHRTEDEASGAEGKELGENELGRADVARRELAPNSRRTIGGGESAV